MTTPPRTVVPADELETRRAARAAASEQPATTLTVIDEAWTVASRLVAWSEGELLVDAQWVRESGVRLWELLEVLRTCEVSRSAQ